jgi:exonuclease VII small subunit
MTRAEAVAQRDELKRLASKRRGRAGFADNVAEIDQMVARLEAGIAAMDAANVGN